MNNLSLSFPEFRLPTVEIEDMSRLSFFEKSSYIPGLSTIKGAADVLFGCASLVAGVALIIFTTVFFIPKWVYEDIQMGQQPFGEQINEVQPYSTVYTREALRWGLCGPLAAVYFIGRGIIESVPVIGNLTIAYLDGRIRIINN